MSSRPSPLALAADPIPHAEVPPFLRGGGACAALIAGRDWSATPLGPIDRWPACLRTATAILLRSPVPIVMLWGEAGVMIYNNAYSQFAGARHPALLGSDAREGRGEVADFNDHVMKTCLAGGTLHFHDQEFTLVRHGRPEPVWMDLDYSPVLDEAGTPAGILCVLAETTGRVAAARRSAFLLSLSDSLRTVDGSAAILTLAAEALGEWMDASRVFYAEITREGMMTVERDYARGVESIVGVHSLASFGPDLLNAYRGGAPVVVRDVPADDRLSDGARTGLTARRVGAFIDVVLFQDEQWVGLLAVQSATPRVWSPAEEDLVQQVGERVKAAIDRTRAAEELRSLADMLERQVIERTTELRRYHAIVEATTAPICAFDTDLRLIAFNAAHNAEFRRVNGFDTKIGDVFPDLFVEDQRESMRRFMTRALTGESFTVAEKFGRPELGTPCWEITYTPLRDGDGRVIGAFHQALDISARLVAEAELADAQEALRQSQKMEAMGSLTGGVAHDFNNLLTPIIGSLDMLTRSGIGSPRERRLIDGALQSAERAKTLVQRLLAFARRQPLQPVPVDLGRLVDNMAGLLGSTLGPTIDMQIAVADGLPPARADANQLEMALLNLAVNARDAMPGGGVLAISVRTATSGAGERPGIPAGEHVCLSVADSGAGMDAATLRRAIEPFFSTKGVGKGTGLGLSMVHGLVAQLGGGMRIESAPGQGTRIELWLPVSADPGHTAIAVAPAPVMARAGRGTVLLVEDEELVRASTADMLAGIGYRVVEAGSAEDALAQVAAGLRPDLLVTDHLMPGMTGAQLAADLKRRMPGLAALIVSGYAEAEGVDPSIARLTKPFRSEELAAGLAALLAPEPA